MTTDETNLDQMLDEVRGLIASAARLVSARRVYEYLLSSPLEDKGAPPGHIGHRKAKKLLTWKFRHGVAQYPRPLSSQQIDRYKLRPVSKTDPYYEPWAIDNLYNDIVRFLIRKDRYLAPTARGHIMIEPSSVAGKQFELHRLNILGNPVGQTVYVNSIRDAAEILWDEMSKERKDEYLDSFEIDL